MSIHTPGPRLYSSVPFKHLAQKDHSGGKAVNVSLNVTPFVDMMTILVTFLLMVFSSTGELLQAQKGLKLPDATVQKDLRTAPVIVVTSDRLDLEGKTMAMLEDIQNDSSMEWKIVSLYDELRARKTRFKLEFDSLPDIEKDRCLDSNNPSPDPKDMCLDGLVILQADKETSAKVLNRILKTAYAAEFQNIMFAVNRRESRPE
ncbi:MAG: biopolymer transporter ExbD [Deltaproteobacteria bacterium]|nr:biopolymer transporter ExbD [Deltaproteobacteria bacterium]